MSHNLHPAGLSNLISYCSPLCQQCCSCTDFSFFSLTMQCFYLWSFPLVSSLERWHFVVNTFFSHRTDRTDTSSNEPSLAAQSVVQQFVPSHSAVFFSLEHSPMSDPEQTSCVNCALLCAWHLWPCRAQKIIFKHQATIDQVSLLTTFFAHLTLAELSSYSSSFSSYGFPSVCQGISFMPAHSFFFSALHGLLFLLEF